MTGPEHYQEAERLLKTSIGVAERGAPRGDHDSVVARAQVHATLALAAATALETAGIYISRTIMDAWTNAVGADQ